MKQTIILGNIITMDDMLVRNWRIRLIPSSPFTMPAQM